MRRVVNMNVLPGEPTDGTGRVCIHLLVRDERGPSVEPHVLHPAVDEHGEPIKQQLVAKPTRVRLACDPKRTVAPKTHAGVTFVVHRAESPRVANCRKCLATREYAEAMEQLTAAEAGG